MDALTLLLDDSAGCEVFVAVLEDPLKGETMPLEVLLDETLLRTGDLL